MKETMLQDRFYNNRFKTKHSLFHSELAPNWLCGRERYDRSNLQIYAGFPISFIFAHIPNTSLDLT